uniref:Uncharacterized protein n=1 Tax=Arundo donax TaxID=35708 RepID=A0A0A9EMM0_ARUDO
MGTFIQEKGKHWMRNQESHLLYLK